MFSVTKGDFEFRSESEKVQAKGRPHAATTIDAMRRGKKASSHVF